MGAYQNNPKTNSPGRKKRGSVHNENRLAAFASKGGSGEADWGACDSKLMQAVVVGITAKGGAVIMGMSRDLGAHSMTLMLDGHRETLWFNGGADLDDALKTVIGTLDAME